MCAETRLLMPACVCVLVYDVFMRVHASMRPAVQQWDPCTSGSVLWPGVERVIYHTAMMRGGEGRGGDKIKDKGEVAEGFRR